MHEFPTIRAEVPPLSPEVMAILPEMARLKLIAELKNNGVCSGFGSTDSDYRFRDNVEKLWRAATGIADHTQFESAFKDLSNLIENQGGAESVCAKYLDDKN
ncbi:MAG: hypothetical protein ABIQ04_04665 [Candidatus Saccharimonadales bacterium]